MSTKITLLLTVANEHWFKDCNGPYYQESKTQKPIVLWFSPDHKIETSEEGTKILIEEGTPLYEKLQDLFLVPKV